MSSNSHGTSVCVWRRGPALGGAQSGALCGQLALSRQPDTNRPPFPTAHRGLPHPVPEPAADGGG